MKLTTAQIDRACGVLLGTAAGDALGAAYEFGPPRGPELEVAMVGGGAFGWEPGEWTDDTSMAIAIAEVAAAGARMLAGGCGPLAPDYYYYSHTRAVSREARIWRTELIGQRGRALRCLVCVCATWEEDHDA